MLWLPVAERCTLVVMATTHSLIDRVFLGFFGFLRKRSEILLLDNVS